MEEEKKQPSTLNFLMIVLSGISILLMILCGLMMKDGRFFAKNESSTAEVPTATVVYQSATKEFTEQQWEMTLFRLERRMKQLGIQGKVSRKGKDEIVVQMKRDYAGEQNIKYLTDEDHIFFYILEEKKPKQEELNQGTVIKSGEKYYRCIFEEEQILRMDCYEVPGENKEQIFTGFNLVLSEEGLQRINQLVKERKKLVLYIMYNEEMLAYQEITKALKSDNISFQNSFSLKHAEYVKQRIKNGNLPVQLKLIENRQ